MDKLPDVEKPKITTTNSVHVTYGKEIYVGKQLPARMLPAKATVVHSHRRSR